MSTASIADIRTTRRMPWLKCGMIIEVEGRRGVVTGGNSHCNLQVRFEGQRRSVNCHPWWQTKYYGSGGEVIADYTAKETQ